MTKCFECDTDLIAKKELNNYYNIVLEVEVLKCSTCAEVYITGVEDVRIRKLIKRISQYN